MSVNPSIIAVPRNGLGVYDLDFAEKMGVAPNLENWPFLQKSVKTWNSQENPSHGKVKENKMFSPHTTFIYSCMVVREVLFHLLSVNVNCITV